MNINKIKREMTNRKYRLIVDQDFIDIYYIMFDIYKECDDTVMGMYRMLEKYVSDYIKEYPLDTLEDVAYGTIRLNIINKYIDVYKYKDFVNNIVRYYTQKFVENKNETRTSQIIIDNNKKYYVIELTFNEIATINTIAGSTGGFLNTSRRCFSGNGCVVTTAVFDVGYYVSSGTCSGIYFTKDVLEYIRRKTKRNHLMR